MIGLLRHIVVAETDAEARRIAKPNIEYHSASLNYLRKKHGSTEFDLARSTCIAAPASRNGSSDGMAIAGSPATVRATIAPAGRGARHQLSAGLSVLRHHDARAGDALVQAVRRRGDAEDRRDLRPRQRGLWMPIVITDEDAARLLSHPGGDRGDAGGVPRPCRAAAPSIRRGCATASRTPDPARRYIANIHAGAVESYRVACVRAGSHFRRGRHEPKRKATADPTAVNWTIIILYDLDTGEPLAFMHETYLSGLRVGATSALAVAEAARAGCAGAGPVRHRQSGVPQLPRDLRGAADQDACRCTAPTRRTGEAFVAKMADEKVEVIAVDDPREVVRGADIVCCATNSKHAGVRRRLARERPDGHHHRQFGRAHQSPRGRRDDLRARERHHHQRLGRASPPIARSTCSDRSRRGWSTARTCTS